MRLCVINNIIMLLIIIVLGKISYNILRNKKNYETFTNSGWSLNHDGELCYESDCKDIAVLGSGDSGKICTISGNTLECDKIEKSAVADDAVAESVIVEDESDENVEPIQGCMDSGATNYKPDATLPGSCTYNNIVYSVDATGVKDNNLEFNNDTKELSANNVKIVTKRTDNWPEEYIEVVDMNIRRTPTINEELLPKQADFSPFYVNRQGVSGVIVIATFSSDLLKFEVQNGKIGITFTNNDEIDYLINISNGKVTSITSS